MVLKIIRYLGQQGYGTDKLVILTPYLGQLRALMDGLKQAEQQIKALADLKMQELAKEYKVEFAAPGENVTRKTIKGEDCKITSGEIIQAVSPNLAQIFAVEQALKHSQPSQMGPDGQDGIKFYFLEKPMVIPLKIFFWIFFIHKERFHQIWSKLEQNPETEL